MKGHLELGSERNCFDLSRYMSYSLVGPTIDILNYWPENVGYYLEDQWNTRWTFAVSSKKVHYLVEQTKHQLL